MAAVELAKRLRPLSFRLRKPVKKLSEKGSYMQLQPHRAPVEMRLKTMAQKHRKKHSPATWVPRFIGMPLAEPFRCLQLNKKIQEKCVCVCSVVYLLVELPRRVLGGRATKNGGTQTFKTRLHFWSWQNCPCARYPADSPKNTTNFANRCQISLPFP